MVWLASRRWWVLAGAFVLVFVGLVRSISVLYIVPVVLVLFLLFFSMLVALIGRRGAPRPPSSH